MLLGDSSSAAFRRHDPTGAHAGRQFALVAVAAVVGFALCFAALVPVVGMLGGSVHIATTLGPLRSLSQRSTIYAADGQTALGALGTKDRQAVPLRDVPQILIDAVVDTEDATFWTNPGVDVAAMSRSLATNVASGRIEEGGSTITQQLAKNRLLTSKRDFHRKLAELSLAIQLNERY